MSKKNPCKPGAKKRLVIIVFGGIAATLLVVGSFYLLGVIDKAMALRSVVALTVMDIGGVVFWWYCGDL